MPRTVKLAAVVLACGIAAAACGSVKMGAAAIVGNQRISAASLNAQVANLSAAYQTYKDRVQPSYSASDLPQLVLSWIVQFRVADEVAARNHITVTPAQADKELDSFASQLTGGGKGVPQAAVAVYLGVPPDMMGDFARWVSTQNELLTRLNGGKTTTILDNSLPAAVTRSRNLAECRAAKSLGIQINPQYGVLNYSSYSVVAAPSVLSRPAGPPSPAATSKPVLTPPC